MKYQANQIAITIRIAITNADITPTESENSSPHNSMRKSTLCVIDWVTIRICSAEFIDKNQI